MDETEDELNAISGPFFTDERFRKTVLRINQERILTIDYILPAIEAMRPIMKLKGKERLFVLNSLTAYIDKETIAFLADME